MPGIDPSILANIGSNQAYPGSPASPMNATPGAGAEPPAKAEPVDLHDSCMEVCETIKSARQMLEDLSAKAEMAADIDPAAEKAIAKASAMLAQVDDTLGTAEEALGAARAEHEDSADDAPDDSADMPA